MYCIHVTLHCTYWTFKQCITSTAANQLSADEPLQCSLLADSSSSSLSPLPRFALPAAKRGMHLLQRTVTGTAVHSRRTATDWYQHTRQCLAAALASPSQTCLCKHTKWHIFTDINVSSDGTYFKIPVYWTSILNIWWIVYCDLRYSPDRVFWKLF